MYTNELIEFLQSLTRLTDISGGPDYIELDGEILDNIIGDLIDFEDLKKMHSD